MALSFTIILLLFTFQAPATRIELRLPLTAKPISRLGLHTLLLGLAEEPLVLVQYLDPADPVAGHQRLLGGWCEKVSDSPPQDTK